MINGEIFSKSSLIYKNVFSKVLAFIIESYYLMIQNEDKIELQKPDEEYIRNILVKKYLRNPKQKKKFDIEYLEFGIEMGEIDEGYKTKGYMDITILNIIHGLDALTLDIDLDINKIQDSSINCFGLEEDHFIDREDIYFCFECKRLDGNKFLTNEYINEGIKRFINGKYSSKMPLAGMIGFVQNGVINKIIENINQIINWDDTTLKSLSHFLIKQDFDHSYHSIHMREKCRIDIYHIIFDFTYTDPSRMVQSKQEHA